MIGVKEIQELKNYPNSLYTELKNEFLFHSNKIEGSTFSPEQLSLLIDKSIVSGEHPFEDVIETSNSLEVFDYMIDTLGGDITVGLILDFHTLLKRNTKDSHYGHVGEWRTIPNRITGSNVILTALWEVPIRIERLLSEWESSAKDFSDIISFHVEFEKIHPFLDGNGRVGRFLMLKQCFESNIVPIALDSKYEREYKRSLENAQLNGSMDGIKSVLSLCQNRFAKKEIVKQTILSLSKMNLLEGKQHEDSSN